MLKRKGLFWTFAVIQGVAFYQLLGFFLLYIDNVTNPNASSLPTSASIIYILILTAFIVSSIGIEYLILSKD